MNLSRIRLITFDVTETLLKFRSSPGKQYGEIGALYGINCDDSNLLTMNFKQHFNKMTIEHPNFGRHTGLGWQNWWKNIVFHTFSNSQINLNQQQLDSITQHLLNIYETAECWQQTHGALNLLSYLRHIGIPLGIISNYDPRLHRVLINTKIRHYFDFVLTSYEIGVAKPHPDIFKYAMMVSKIENLQNSECLHIGNAPDYDYMGAKNSGWHAILVQNKKDDNSIKQKYPYVDFTYTFSNLFELHKYFLENNTNNNDSTKQTRQHI